MPLVRSLLFGSRLRILVTLVAVLSAGIGGAVFAGVLGAPSVGGVENRFGDVNSSTTVIKTDLIVNNPNPIGVNLGGVSVNYSVRMNGLQMANGQKEGLNVGSGNSTLHLATGMDNRKIPAWWASHVRNGEHTDLAVQATVHSETLGRSIDAPPVERSIDTDLLSAFNSTDARPINADQPIVSNPVLWINRTGASWGAATESRTPIEIEFVVYNPKPWAVPISELGYDVTMNGIDVGEGRTDESYVIPPGSTKTITTTVVIDNAHLDDWWVSHLERNQETDLRIDFYAKIDLSSAGAGTVRVPVDDLDYEKTFETDVFGTKNDSNGGETATSGNGSTPSETESDDTTGTTKSPTATPSSTPTSTPEATTEDDGGILERAPFPAVVSS